MIDKLNNSELDAITEVFHNLLHDVFKIKPKEKKTLVRYRNVIENIAANRKKSLKVRRKHVKQAGGFLPLLPLVLGTIAPVVSTITSVLAKKVIK